MKYGFRLGLGSEIKISVPIVFNSSGFWDSSNLPPVSTTKFIKKVVKILKLDPKHSASWILMGWAQLENPVKIKPKKPTI